MRESLAEPQKGDETVIPPASSKDKAKDKDLDKDLEDKIDDDRDIPDNLRARVKADDGEDPEFGMEMNEVRPEGDIAPKPASIPKGDPIDDDPVEPVPKIEDQPVDRGISLKETDRPPPDDIPRSIIGEPIPKIGDQPYTPNYRNSTPSIRPTEPVRSNADWRLPPEASRGGISMERNQANVNPEPTEPPTPRTARREPAPERPNLEPNPSVEPANGRLPRQVGMRARLPAQTGEAGALRETDIYRNLRVANTERIAVQSLNYGDAGLTSATNPLSLMKVQVSQMGGFRGGLTPQIEGLPQGVSFRNSTTLRSTGAVQNAQVWQETAGYPSAYPVAEAPMLGETLGADAGLSALASAGEDLALLALA